MRGWAIRLPSVPRAFQTAPAEGKRRVDAARKRPGVHHVRAMVQHAASPTASNLRKTRGSLLRPSASPRNRARSGVACRGDGFLDRAGINGFHAALLGKRDISSPQKESLRYRPCKSDRGAHVIVTQSNGSAGRLIKPADSGVSSSAKRGSGIMRKTPHGLPGTEDSSASQPVPRKGQGTTTQQTDDEAPTPAGGGSCVTLIVRCDRSSSTTPAPRGFCGRSFRSGPDRQSVRTDRHRRFPHSHHILIASEKSKLYPISIDKIDAVEGLS